MAPPPARRGLRAMRARSLELDSRECLMSRRHANLIRSIFHDPPSGNVQDVDRESAGHDTLCGL